MFYLTRVAHKIVSKVWTYLNGHKWMALQTGIAWLETAK